MGEIVTHRKAGTRRAVGRWYRRDVETMARQGYVEVHHQIDGVERGCAAIILPKLAEMVVVYRKA